MTYYERVDQLRDNTNFTTDDFEHAYLTAEIVLVDLLGEFLKGAEINSTTYGTGKVVGTYGDTLDRMIMEVAFVDTVRKFGVLPVVTGKALFNKFADISEVGDAWDHAFDLHTDITKKFADIKREVAKQAYEAAKKAEADKLAKEKFEATKARAIRDFEKLSNTVVPTSTTDEFYYSLGWLAKHVGSVSARLPDYLSDSFTRHFGHDAVHTSVDSRKKTINGNSMQWTFGFTATLRKPENIPAALIAHLGSTGKQIADTSFIWDLVDNYGFQFGKQQDIDKIRSHVPSDFLSFFEAGLI
jgi:hypothetical protein